MYVIRNMISHICFILAGQLSPALLTASTCREMLALGAHVRWCNDMAPAPETHVYRAAHIHVRNCEEQFYNGLSLPCPNAAKEHHTKSISFLTSFLCSNLRLPLTMATWMVIVAVETIWMVATETTLNGGSRGSQGPEQIGDDPED
eukprot:scaffold307103_cov23-Tisochrysis_lutea.AAC.1